LAKNECQGKAHAQNPMFAYKGLPQGIKFEEGDNLFVVM
jgi:hypothetical protein